MEKVRQKEVDEDLGSIPTAREVTRALGKLKNGKVPGSSNVLPEMLKMVMKDGQFGQMVLNLVKAVWKDKRVPKEWVVLSPRREICIAVTTGGGIPLLDVMGKVMVRVIQGRLQKLAEWVLPKSQCGFSRGRGGALTWSLLSDSSLRRL